MARVWTASATASGDLELVADHPELGEHINHAIRDGRFPLVWLATDTGIWKTPDEGVTMLQVKAAPGATMVAYGALQPVATVESVGHLIVSAFEFTSGAHAIIALTSSGWAKRADHPDTTTGGAERPLWRFGTTLYTMIRRGDGPGYTSVGAQTLWRSTDDGVTWTPSPVGAAVDLACDVNGVLWALRASLGSGNADEIAKSTDDGLSWTTVRNFAALGRFFRRLDASPTTAGAHALAWDGWIYKTTDDWASYTAYDTPNSASTPFGVNIDFLSSGDAVVYQHGDSYYPYRVPFATWNTLTEITAGGQEMMTALVRTALPASTLMLGPGGLWQSDDDGLTWTNQYGGPGRGYVGTPGQTEYFGLDGAQRGAGAQPYAPGHSTTILRRAAGGAWENLTDAMIAAFGGATLYIPHLEGMVAG